MEINGKEIRFKATVGALIDLADICPDGDVNRVTELVQGMTADTLRHSVAIIRILSNGDLDDEAIRRLDVHELQQLLDEAFAAFRADQQGKVDVKITKKDEATDQ